MTLEELQQKQEKEQLQFMAAQVRAWQDLQARHERLRQSGNDNLPEHQQQIEQDLKCYHEEWGSEGRHAEALAKRHGAERLKISNGNAFPQQSSERKVEPIKRYSHTYRRKRK